MAVAVLGALGYIANAEQTPAVVSGITAMFTWVPGLIAILAAIPFFFYKLSNKKHHEIMEHMIENPTSAN